MRNASLEMPDGPSISPAMTWSPVAAEVERWLTDHIARRLEVAASEIDPHGALAAFGLDSLQVMSLIGDLEDLLNKELPDGLVGETTTIAELAATLAAIARGEGGDSQS